MVQDNHKIPKQPIQKFKVKFLHIALKEKTFGATCIICDSRWSTSCYSYIYRERGIYPNLAYIIITLYEILPKIDFYVAVLRYLHSWGIFRIFRSTYMRLRNSLFTANSHHNHFSIARLCMKDTLLVSHSVASVSMNDVYHQCRWAMINVHT